MTKLTSGIALFLPAALLAAAAGGAPGQAPKTSDSAASVAVTHLIGMQDLKPKAKGALTVQGGLVQVVCGPSKAEVAASSIEDVVTGSETTQGGGTAGTVAKTAAIAAPYGSGAALKVMLRTKVDILTLVYRGSNGELHSAIFSLKRGQATQVQAQLTAAGAHVQTRPE
jgi:hypothetical protein